MGHFWKATNSYSGPALFSNETAPNLPDWYITENEVDIDTSAAIGFGGDAKVYKGVLKDGNPVAVKIFNRKSVETKEKFFSTMKLWERLSRYDNICRLYGACYFTATPFVVMEYCEKGPLDTFLRRDGSNRCNVSLDILAQAAQAIAKMHSIGVVHGDLKCDNILVSGTRQAKVCDFDRSFDWIALKDRRLVNGTATDAGIQITDAVRYLAPECVKGMLPNTKSDVYSFGMTIYHAQVGELPYTDISSDEELRTCKLNGELPAREGNLIGDNVWELVTQCCDAMPTERPTMETVVSVLRSLLNQHQLRNLVKITNSAGDEYSKFAAGPEARNIKAASVHKLKPSFSHDDVGADHPSNPTKKKTKRVKPDLGDGALVKVKPSKSTIPRLCKLVGVVALVVIGIVVGVVVSLKSSSDTSEFIANTGSYSSFSSAGSDTSSGSYWPSSAASSDTTSGSYEPSTSGGSDTSSHSNWLPASTSSTGASSSTSSIGSSSFSSSADLSWATSSAGAGSSSSGSSSNGASSSPGIVQVSILVDSGSYLTTDGGIAMASNGVIYLSDGFRILQLTEGSVPVLYAGSGSTDYQYVDGALLDARFNSISALAMGSSGDLFICDYYKVRKISGNTVSTLYSGASGLSYQGIAVDSSGNVFITDYYNGKITKITSKGASSTFSTSLSNPSGIVIDSADNIYVTDNNRVIKFTSGGAMTVLAGTTSSGLVDGTGTSARFNTPDSLAIGSDGDLFIADRVNYCIRRLNIATTEVTTFVESGPFNSIWGMAAAADTVLYVRDRYSASIQRVLKVYYLSSVSLASSANSASSTSSGLSASSSAAGSHVSVLVGSGSYLTTDGGIAMSSNGNIYLSDGARILQMTDGSVPTLYAGSSGDMNFVDGSLLIARFYLISALAISSSGDLFVCDFYKVRKVSGNTVSTLYTAPSSLSFYGIAVDSSGNVYVTDYNNGKITKITSTGASSTFSTSLSKPRGIVIDLADNIYVTDNNRVIKFTSGGAMSVLAGSEESGFADGTGTSARFQRPDSMAIGTDGGLYVADRANYCIRRVSLANSEVSTYVSSGPFEVIWAMVAAPDNVLYVRDRIAYYNQRVLKVYRA